MSHEELSEKIATMDRRLLAIEVKLEIMLSMFEQLERAAESGATGQELAARLRGVRESA